MNNQTLTPYQMNILMHIYCNCDDFTLYRNQLFAKTLSNFVGNRIIKTSNKYDHGYELTEKGKAWVADILCTPVPTAAWIGRDGNTFMVDED